MEDLALGFHILHRHGHSFADVCVRTRAHAHAHTHTHAHALIAGSYNKSYKEDDNRPLYGDPAIRMDPWLK